MAGVPTTYTQDIAAPLPVVLQVKTGTTTTQYLYSLGTRPVAQYVSSAWQYLLPDALGSVRQIADASGNILLTESYQPYGSVLTSTGNATSIFGYAGEQFDSYIKLLFLRSRYYSPDTARFLSKDSWQGDYTSPQSLDGWSYVSGNPINKVDPTGLREYRIWAAAFIPSHRLKFAYPFGAMYGPNPFWYDPNAEWQGDNRGFATGNVNTMFNATYGLPDTEGGSSRVWNEVLVDTNASLANPIVFNGYDTGRSYVYYTDENGTPQMRTDKAERPQPAWATRSPINSCVFRISIYTSVGNPLFKLPVLGDIAPPIVYEYNLVFDTQNRKLEITGDYTRFPAQELYVAGIDQPAIVNALPSGPNYTPSDLFYPPDGVYAVYDLPSDEACSCR